MTRLRHDPMTILGLITLLLLALVYGIPVAGQSILPVVQVAPPERGEGPFSVVWVTASAGSAIGLLGGASSGNGFVTLGLAGLGVLVARAVSWSFHTHAL